MRKILILAPLFATAACTTITDTQVQGLLTAAIAAETTAAIRCPKHGVERAVFLAGRVYFQINVAPRLSPMQAEAYAAARTAADQACGFTASEAAAAAMAVDG